VAWLLSKAPDIWIQFIGFSTWQGYRPRPDSLYVEKGYFATVAFGERAKCTGDFVPNDPMSITVVTVTFNKLYGFTR
jgi:hypothetical protein